MTVKQNVLPFRRNEINSDEDMTFWVTMLPHTRKGTPIELVLTRKSANQALYDAMQEVGLSKQEEFKYLEMLHKTGKDSWRVAYFNQTRNFTSDFDISLPIKRKAGDTTEVSLTKKPPQPAKAEEEDDYKETGFEVSSD